MYIYKRAAQPAHAANRVVSTLNFTLGSLPVAGLASATRRLMREPFGIGNEMDIRRATPDDATALAKVHIDSWRAAYRGLVPDSRLDTLDYDRRAQRFRESIGAHSEETYLVEQDGEVLGFLTVGGCRDTDVNQEATGEIWGIYLAPEHWRKGVGSLLCRRGEQILTSRGYAQATLWVFEANQQGRGFYEAMGFETDGATKVLNPGAPLKAVRYRKALGNAEPGVNTDQ